MSAENKALARYFEEVWNLQKPAVLDQIIANGAIDNDPANPSLPVGPEGQKQLFTKYTAAFPDSQFTVGANHCRRRSGRRPLVGAWHSPRYLGGSCCHREAGKPDRYDDHAHRQRENCGDVEQLGCARHVAATRGCGSGARRIAGLSRCSFLLIARYVP